MMTVTEALQRRISVREFKSDSVPEALVREILSVASRAPSGGNLQPWKVIAVAGAERDAVIQLAARTLAANPQARSATGRCIHLSYSSRIVRGATSSAKTCTRCSYRTRRQSRTPRAFRTQLRILRRAGRAVLCDRRFAWATANGLTSACSCNRSRSRRSSAA